ncbi:MAG: hypothetical protein WHX52_00980 [Anaerolineae bacterium]
MTRSIWYRIAIVSLLLLFSVNPGRITVAAPDNPMQEESMDGLRRPVVLRLDPSISTLRIPPPDSYARYAPLRVQTATINVTYLPNGATDAFGYSCLTWPTEAVTAFNYAVDIWETLINSTVPIEVNACWTNFGDPNVLGIGGADNYYRNFTGAPQTDTWYPTALANALHGSRMSGSTVDMHVSYGSTFPWYFGTDGNTPTDKVDFASVVLHEICHGLGFAGSMVVSGGLGYWGWVESIYPVGYDRYAENGAGTALLSYTYGSTALAGQLTSNNVYFDGPYANAANGGARPKLFAPATWMQGSSYSHLDEIFNGTANDLMTYAIPNGQSTHAPGPIALGILRDIGWSSGENTPPTLSGLPDQTLAPGQSKNGAINLWTYASDAQDVNANLAFTITNSPPLTVGVTIRDDQYIDINPTASFTGTFPVVVQVMDTGGLTDTDSFTITFTEIETQYIFLPLVLRCYPLVPFLSPISNPDGDGLYTVQWAMPSCCTQTPSQYEFQVATDPQFSYVDGDTTMATSINVYTPDPATYYWRVRAYINGQWTGWSNVQSVVVGSFSYVYVQNDTGGTLTIEIVGIEKRSFATGLTYWRSVPTGYHTLNVWANCGSLLGRSVNFPLGEFLLRYYCGSQALSGASGVAAPEMPNVDFIFEAIAP